MKLLKLSTGILASLMLVVTSVSVAGALTQKSSNILLAQSKVAAPAPQKLTNAALRNARKEWGLRANGGKIAKTEQTKFTPDCGTVPLPLCDVAVMQGYKITIADGNKGWLYFVDNSANNIFLLARTPQNRTTIPLNTLPEGVMDNVRNLASKHLQLPQYVLLIKRIEQNNWKSICNEWALPNAQCATDKNKRGWRVVIEGKPGQEFVYLTGEQYGEVRTEATKKMASRSDLMPSTWAKNIVQTTSKKYQIPSQQVYITSAEQKAKGNYFWEVQVDSRQGCQVTYELDLSGTITKETSKMGCK
jgi:hypothetical protein